LRLPILVATPAPSTRFSGYSRLSFGNHVVRMLVLSSLSLSRAETVCGVASNTVRVVCSPRHHSLPRRQAVGQVASPSPYEIGLSSAQTAGPGLGVFACPCEVTFHHAGRDIQFVLKEAVCDMFGYGCARGVHH
jgi:hypothetical protein